MEAQEPRALLELAKQLLFELNSLGFKISRKTVTKYMQKLGLRSKLRKKFKVTTNSKQNYLVQQKKTSQHAKL